MSSILIVEYVINFKKCGGNAYWAGVRWMLMWGGGSAKNKEV